MIIQISRFLTWLIAWSQSHFNEMSFPLCFPISITTNHPMILSLARMSFPLFLTHYFFPHFPNLANPLFFLVWPAKAPFGHLPFIALFPNWEWHMLIMWRLRPKGSGLVQRGPGSCGLGLKSLNEFKAHFTCRVVYQANSNDINSRAQLSFGANVDVSSILMWKNSVRNANGRPYKINVSV